MKYSWSNRSDTVLDSVDGRLQNIFDEVIKVVPFDIGIPTTGGKRTAEEQQELFLAGKSKKDGYKKLSRHQSGLAIDVFIYLNGKATWEPDLYKVLAGVVFSAAKRQGYKIRWGGDWNQDWNLKNDNWLDCVHFELID